MAFKAYIQYSFAVYCIIILFTNIGNAQSSTEVLLHSSTLDSNSKIHLYLSEKKEPSPTVLIMPGGGYQMLAMEHEGKIVAEWFQKKGVNAIVLEYALGKFDGSGSKHPEMLNDAKQAMRLLRYNANKWNIDPDMIAVMGFSAGGHLASTLATHSDSGYPDSLNVIAQQSCVPNLCILFYPVIMMEGPYTHWGSRRFLLGPTPKPEDIKLLSNDKHVTVSTPPTILFHTSDDTSVPVENSIQYYLALRKYGIPAELHVSEHGAHGMGLISNDYSISQWETLLENWLTRWKWIPSK